MRIEVKQGESLTVCFADTDGEFVIKYGKKKLTVKSDLPDSSGREGTIYSAMLSMTMKFPPSHMTGV